MGEGNGVSRANGRYMRLPAGMHGLRRESVAADQRRRLCMAMVELIATRGYTAIRIEDLTRLAGVSRPTFYQLFADKQACFIAAYEQAAAMTGEAILGAYEAAQAPADRTRAALRAFFELAASHPHEISLLVLGSLGAGEAARERRERTLRTLNRRVRGGRNGSADDREDLTVTVVLGGIREVTAARLRTGRAAELPALTDEIAAWAGSYPPVPPKGIEPPVSAAQRRRALAAIRTVPFERSGPPGGRLPSGRHDLSARFVERSQRERILDAVAQLTAENGYEKLSIPGIARRAGVSHQTFYELYATKQNAFLAAMRRGAQEPLRAGAEAHETQSGQWPRAVTAGMHAMLRSIAAEPDYATLGFVEMLAAGPEALDLRDENARAFTAYLNPGYELATAGRPVPRIASEAIAGGVWQLIHLQVAAGRAAELPLLAPMLIYATLTPFVGAKEAARHARRKPSG